MGRPASFGLAGLQVTTGKRIGYITSQVAPDAVDRREPRVDRYQVDDIAFASVGDPGSAGGQAVWCWPFGWWFVGVPGEFEAGEVAVVHPEHDLALEFPGFVVNEVPAGEWAVRGGRAWCCSRHGEVKECGATVQVDGRGVELGDEVVGVR
jgi:hypothetical protein